MVSRNTLVLLRSLLNHKNNHTLSALMLVYICVLNCCNDFFDGTKQEEECLAGKGKEVSKEQLASQKDTNWKLGSFQGPGLST